MTGAITGFTFANPDAVTAAQTAESASPVRELVAQLLDGIDDSYHELVDDLVVALRGHRLKAAATIAEQIRHRCDDHARLGL